MNKLDFRAALAKELENDGLYDMPDDFVDELTQCLYTIDTLTHNRLTVKELNHSYAFLSGLLDGQFPKVAAIVPSHDRIRLPFSMFEVMESTKGKLTEHEKAIYAFCVFHSTCVEVYDEEADDIRSGIVDIETPQHVMSLFVEDMENHPERYKFLNGEDEDEDEVADSEHPFGTSIDNPVKAISISDGYMYLESLMTPDGKPVQYKHNGSMFGNSGGIIDKYTLSFTYGGEKQTITLYIDPYASRNSTQAPEGLMLAD